MVGIDVTEGGERRDDGLKPEALVLEDMGVCALENMVQE